MQKAIPFLITIAALLISCGSANTQEIEFSEEEKPSIDNIDLQQFIKETQINQGRREAWKFAWWIPVEFWEMILQPDQFLTESQIAETINLLRPYAIFGVIDGEIGTGGYFVYQSAETIRTENKI